MDSVSVNEDEFDWRIKNRLKTVSCLLVICLNIGVDPPDAAVGVKPSPCARLESWIDPFQLPPQKSLELIGRALQVIHCRYDCGISFVVSI